MNTISSLRIICDNELCPFLDSDFFIQFFLYQFIEKLWTSLKNSKHKKREASMLFIYVFFYNETISILLFQFRTIFILLLVLYISPSGDKSTVGQEFCGNWQLLWTYLRSTLQLAAVLTALKEPFRQSWRPGMAVLRPREAVLRPWQAQ